MGSRRRPWAWTAAHDRLSRPDIGWVQVNSLVCLCIERESVKNSAGESSMNPPSQTAGRVALMGCLSLAIPGLIQAQDPKPASPPAPMTQPGQTPCVQEVGGRLVVCSEAVVVTGNPDEPPRDSSIATKIETPLLETQRSVSIIDRRTIDDMGAVTMARRLPAIGHR